MAKKSVIRDLIYRIEGYSDKLDYEIRSIAKIGGRIIIDIIDNEYRNEPKGAAATDPQDDDTDCGQAEQGAAE